VGFQLKKVFLTALFKGIWIFSLIAWLYAITKEAGRKSLSLYLPIPTDLFALATFTLAFVSFVVWETLRRTPGY
jgi:hypothetical protein